MLSLVEIGLLEKTIFKFCDVFSQFRTCNHPPSKKEGPSFMWTNIPFTHGWFVPSLIEFGQLEKTIFFKKLSMYFHYFLIFFLWKKDGSSLKKFKFPSRMICAYLDWNRSSDSGEEDFLNSSMHFRKFVIISSWKRAEPFIWTNLNSLHAKMPCARKKWGDTQHC